MLILIKTQAQIFNSFGSLYSPFNSSDNVKGFFPAGIGKRQVVLCGLAW